MRTSYSENDVILLLKDITGLVEPLPTSERERQIQAGRHYCEMLPIEYVPTQKYMETYQAALKHYAADTARAVANLGDKIMKRRGKDTVLVSLARAGIPIGILLKHYMEKQYKVVMPHYSISIIRGKGIDENAIEYLLERYKPEELLFVDGWIGKGAILTELRKDLRQWPDISPELAVVADPAHITNLFGTREDLLIPSSCLNSTVSGLVSRTFLRDDIIGPKDFHGAVYYGELKDADLSYAFIEEIEKYFPTAGAEDSENINPTAGAEDSENTTPTAGTEDSEHYGIDEVKRIATEYGIDDINLIKPGIGEATRVLLRRVPWKVLIAEDRKDDRALEHLRQLAAEKDVPVEYYPLHNYKACGLIKKIADA